MNKLILPFSLLTLILSCQNENNGTKNNSTSNDKSSDENQAKILKEKEEQRIKDSLKLVEDEKKEIESYSGNYTIPSPYGPALSISQTVGRSEITFEVKNGLILAIEQSGDYRDTENLRDVYIKSKTLFKDELKLNKKYKISDYIIPEYKEAFGSDYFEFKDHKLFLYDKSLKLIRNWICCKEPYQTENRCDCIISKSN